MKRFQVSVVSGRILTAFGYLAVVAGASVASVALAGIAPVPEIDPASAGSVASVVVGALALREGLALKRRGRG